MAAKGYCTADEVAAYMGRAGSLTADQLTQLGSIIEAAETWIDGKLGFGYLGPAVVDEYRIAHDNTFYLGPIASIQSLKFFGYDYQAPYTIIDASKGRIRLNDTFRSGAIIGVLVSYTPSSTVPASIKRAAIVLSAHWLMPMLDPDRQGVKQYSYAGDYSVTFTDSATQDGVPSQVYTLLESFGSGMSLA